MGSVCVDVDSLDLECTDKIFYGETNSDCVNRIVTFDDSFGDLEGCAYDTVFALSEEMIDIVETITTCMATRLNTAAPDGEEKEHKGEVLKIVIATAFLVVIGIVVAILFLNQKRKRDMDANATAYTVMPENEIGDTL